MLRELPRYECLLEAAQRYPALDPSATEVHLHLLRAGDEAYRLCSEHLHEHQLSQGRFTVLMLLLDKSTGDSRTSTPAELADQSGVTRATMTGLIDTLERDGMVARAPDPQDRRQMVVSLTPRGLATIEGILPEHFRRVAASLSTLSESERKTLVRLLTKITAQAAVVAPPRRPEVPSTSPRSSPTAAGA